MPKLGVKNDTEDKVKDTASKKKSTANKEKEMSKAATYKETTTATNDKLSVESKKPKSTRQPRYSHRFSNKSNSQKTVLTNPDKAIMP